MSENNDELAMRIISKHTVKPNEPTWSGILPLTELDQISIVTHTSAVYFYKRPVHEEWLSPSTNKIINTLKDSLSRALVPFYPLAGRLSSIGGGRLRLECNAMGADLIEVESTMKIAAFGDFYSSSAKFQDLLPPMDYYGKPIEELPLMAVQVTRFACDGLCVGISISHVVVDGRSWAHFMVEWTRLARGEPLGVAPFLDRQILQAENASGCRTTPRDGENVNYYQQLRRLGEEEYLGWGKKATPTFVHLTRDQIEHLKEVANSNREATSVIGRPYSRFEVLTAHTWICVCKAQELKGEDTATLTVCVDSRGRMDPPLPSSYFGNATVDIEISSTAGDLISKHLSYACSKIREAVTKVTNEYVLEYINFFKKQESLTKFQVIEDRGKTLGPSFGENNTMVISWLNLEGCGCWDFGWGKEIHVGPPYVYAAVGEIMITPYKRDGSIVVVACLHPKLKFREYMETTASQNAPICTRFTMKD